MKTLKLVSVFTILCLLVVFLPANSVMAAPADKVDVCHNLGNGEYIMINISDNAFASHVEHGDASPGEPVPGMPGKIFDAECNVIDEFVYIETLTVDGKGAIATGSTALASGSRYQLRASGTYTYGSGFGGIADAKFSYRPANITPFYQDGWYDGALLSTTYALQVVLYEGVRGAPLTSLGWMEDYNAAHLYTATYMGDGSPLSLYIWDSNPYPYSDNSGSITVDIYLWN